MSDAVKLEFKGRVAVVTLNRPDSANVLSDEMAASLRDTVKRVDGRVKRGEVGAMMLTAEGPHFCAGGDIKGFSAAAADLSSNLDNALPMLNDMIMKIHQLDIPVVNALNGSVGGGGIGLALSGDIVLAAEGMKLRGGYSAIGLTPDLGSSWFLTRLAGPMVAKQILLLNRTLTASECQRLGIVSAVFPNDQLFGEALEMATALSVGASSAFREIKSLVNCAMQRTLVEQMSAEASCMVKASAGQEAPEGISAFVGKRRPIFN